jgi:Peptidase M15
VLGAVIVLSASLSAPSSQTDFGVRLIGVPEAPARAAEAAVNEVVSSGRLNLSSAAALGAHWGRVTSTFRSPEHNREVGGVPNSYHLLGRAIDIARAPGVNHAMIKEAYLRAGYRLVESLDEGDHSHFAFSWGEPRIASYRPAEKTEATEWKVVYAPAGSN